MLRASCAASAEQVGTSDSDLSGYHVESWRSQAPFTDEAVWLQRIEREHLTQRQFIHLLGESSETIRGRHAATPAWLHRLEEGFRGPRDGLGPLDRRGPRAATGADDPGQALFAFLVMVEPLLRAGVDRVRDGARQLAGGRPHVPFEVDTIAELFTESLELSLRRMLSRTLVLELHVARMEGSLAGDTPAARFASFVASLGRRERALEILREYPVLSRQIVQRIDTWTEATLECLTRMCADWDALAAAFSLRRDAVLCKVSGDLGDGHRGGRHVLMMDFRDGSRVIYKPRSLAVDTHFQELLAWVNERGDHPSLRGLRVLDRGTHGWCELVRAEPCGSREEVERFYRRQGAYLALLYAVQATDFHLENLIACGEHPVLVDLESLFHTDLKGLGSSGANAPVLLALNRSVLRVALLPQRSWAIDGSDGIDMSGMSGAAGQLTPAPVALWENPGTDAMQFVRRQLETEGSQNRPRLDGSAVDVREHSDAVVAGFTSMYRTLARHAEELLAEDGPLARFAGDEVRVLFRSTQTYDNLLRESFHPDVLRDAVDRDRLFDKLWLPVAQCPYLPRIIPAEQDDLRQLDIPMFTTRPGSRDLWTGAGERIPDFFHETSLEMVRRHIAGFGEDDLVHQTWLIRASFAALSVNVAEPPARSPSPPTTSVVERDRLLAAARSIGDRLESLALGDDRQSSWVGVSFVRERFWSILPLGIDLYDGLPGVVLFLAYLGHVTADERYRRLARAGLGGLRRELAIKHATAHQIGAFNGQAGLLYLWTHLASLWDDAALLAEANQVVAAMEPLVARDRSFDIIGGAAGCIGALRGLRGTAVWPSALRRAIQCGEHLAAHARPTVHGVGWFVASSAPLLGFSHGAAGMGWALFQLAEASGESRFADLARRALDHEHQMFAPDVGNWPDLRDLGPDTGPRFSTFWCHGAPGVALGRLGSLAQHDDARVRADIDIALRTTVRDGPCGNHSLCHGTLGNLDALVVAGRVLGEPCWLDQARRGAAGIVEAIEQRGWLCGSPANVETPGLMTGLAGIGYQLLRLADPDRIPSVLLLEPPVRD